MKPMDLPIVAKVVAVGATEWHATDWKTIGRFRGTTQKEVAVKDDSGKPAYRATRSISFWICCKGGVSYRFDNDATFRGSPYIRIYIHGTWFRLHHWDEDKIPATVREAYDRSVRRTKVCLRIMRVEFAALPRFRPRTA